jgi:hypothetical protein
MGDTWHMLTSASVWPGDVAADLEICMTWRIMVGSLELETLSFGLRGMSEISTRVRFQGEL